MKEKIIIKVLQEMKPNLSNSQLKQLEEVLFVTLSFYGSNRNGKEPDAGFDNSWQIQLDDFLSNKIFEGKSQGTIKQYRYELEQLLSTLSKDVMYIESADILEYLKKYKREKNIGNQSMENKRLIYSSFFSWLHKNGLILLNPMTNITRFKVEQKIRKPFSDEERELLSISATNLRDKAIMEFLYSTCVRVSELSSINIKDIRFAERDLVVYGKGAKERIVYINSRTSVYLQLYLKSRTDDNPALFVSLKKPHNRLTKSGIEAMVHNIGKKANVSNAHPHRFRRTGATNAANRGMPIEEVAAMLGHQKLETTKMYCTVKQQSVKFHHDKYLSA